LPYEGTVGRRRVAHTRNQAQRRSQLVDAAARAVLRQGATEAKLRDVAEEAALTPASILYYFRDKHELLTEVYTHGTTAYVQHRRERVQSAATAWEKLEACIASGVPMRGTEEMTASQLLCELLPLTFRDRKAASAHAEFNAAQIALYRDILERGAASGNFTLTMPAPVLARILLALEDGYVSEVLSGNLEPAEVREHILSLARASTGVTAPDQCDV